MNIPGETESHLRKMLGAMQEAAIHLGSSLNRVGRGFNHKLNILVSAGSAYFLMHA